MTLALGKKYLHMGRPMTLLYVRTSGLAIVLSEEENVYSVQSTDLLPLPRSLEMWVNIYRDGGFDAWSSLDDANTMSLLGRAVPCKKVVVEY